jgi:2-keto-4-pentenoate hydratase
VYEALLDLRRRTLASGHRPLGWKLGLGTAAAMESLGTAAPLVGFLTDRSLLEDGGTVSLDGWASPRFEAEISVHLDSGGGIAGFGAAIELADLDRPPSDVQTVLGQNIFHRRVVLGPERVDSVDGLSARIFRNGELLETVPDVQSLTGRVAPLVAVVRDAVGDELRPGEVIITGAIVPPLLVESGQTLRYELQSVGSLSVTFA